MEGRALTIWERLDRALKLHKVKPLVYVAGPMTGYEFSNFPAFDAARDELVAQGFEVVSPADQDRKMGLDAVKGIAPKGYLEDDEIRVRYNRRFMMLDLDWVARVDYVYFLKGWERSRGARAEYAAACFYRDLCGGKPQLLFQEGAAKGIAWFVAEEVVHP